MATMLGLMSGGAPFYRKFQVEETFANPGVMALIAASGTAGLDLPTTTTAVDCAGLTIDTATYSTSQGTGENSAEALVTVILNTDCIWRFRLAGGATAGTALAPRTVTSEDTGGTVATTGDNWSSPTYDEGSLWCYSGANAGMYRKVTSVSSSAATVTIPLDNTIAVGDQFIGAPWFPWDLNYTMQTTTDFTEANQIIAVGTGQATWYNIGGEYKTIYEEGTTDSYGHFIFGQYLINQLS